MRSLLHYTTRTILRRLPTAPPWVGMSNEGELKEKILALSVDERNFVRDPPAGQNSSVDLKENMGMAMAILAEDSALEEMRFKLVPKTCTEDRFWGNYLYRVSLIVQSAGVASMAVPQVDGGGNGDGIEGGRDSSGSGGGGGGGGDGGGGVGSASGGCGSAANLEAPVVVSVDVSELGGPSQEVGVDPAEQEGDLSDHELEEFEDGNVYAADSRDGAGGAAIDLSALGANVGFPTSTAADADADVEALPAAQEEANDEMEELEEPEEDAEGQEDEAALQPSSSPSPADEAPSPDDDWEKELADELNDFELVDGEDGELDDADLEDLDGMLDDVESTD